MPTLKIAFLNMITPGWTAGGHYLRNLFSALRSLEDGNSVEFFLLTKQATPSSEYTLLQPFLSGVVHFPVSAWARAVKSLYLRLPLPERLERIFLPRQMLLANLRAAGVQALFANDEFGPGFDLPLLGWIPDFQHLHLPQMFSKTKIETRIQHNRRMARYANRVILSSQDAQQDFIRLSPEAQTKVRLLHFVALAPDQAYLMDPREVCDLYHLPERFFYLPNQFWPHKNHHLVIEALIRLRERCPDLLVVSTGNPRSFQGTSVYDQVMEDVKRYSLQNNFRYLGVIPYEQIFQFMRQSLAVVQPSLFEGWSTIVEECRSLGKPMLLSDLPVHREQAIPGAIYFNPYEPQALAELLTDAWGSRYPGPDPIRELDARADMTVCTRVFGQNFLQIVREVIQ